MRCLSIMRKVPLGPRLSLPISYVLVVTLLSALPSYAQETTALQKVRGLKNPSFTNKLTVYYSPGYEKRAKELQRMIEEAMGFYERKFKVTVELNLAVLTQDQWRQVRNTPYGLPGFSESPNIAFLPATADGVVTTGVLSLNSSASPATLKKIKSSGYTFNQGAIQFTDLIGLHELGHVYQIGLGLHPRRLNKWFSEFLGSYFAYAYMREKHPKLATLFYAMAADLSAESPRPAHTSLEDFEQLYVRVGPNNYSWYQGKFLQRVAQVYENKGLSFIAEVGKAFPSSEAEALPVDIVLQRLEKISPGFIEWSKDLR